MGVDMATTGNPIATDLYEQSDGSRNGAFPSSAQPVSSGIDSFSVDGWTVDDTITFLGKGFTNNAPVVQIYDGCDGTATADQTLSDPSRGIYDSIATVPAKYEAGGMDGGSCLRTLTGLGVHHPFHTVFKGCTEFMLIHSLKYVSGSYFPAGVSPNSFPVSSSARKFNWISKDPGGQSGRNDLCLPSHYSGGGTMGVAGNDYNYMLNAELGGTPVEWWEWDSWMTIRQHYKADPDNPSTVNGTGRFQVFNSVDNMWEYVKTDAPLFDTDGNDVRDWTRMNFVGWARETAAGTVQEQFDDIALQVGSNAGACLLLTEAATLATSKLMSYCPNKYWSDGRASIQPGPLDLSGSTAIWAHLILSDGTTYTEQVITP